MHVYLGPTAEQLAAIPDVLTRRRHWVLWRAYPRANQPDKVDKRPINPSDLTNASSTDALTWGSFQTCVAALPTALEEWEHDTRTPYLGGGVGYVTTQNDPYVGVDLDDCVDEVTGAIAPWAQAYLERLASYSEVTPSSRGLRIWVEADLPPGHNRKGQVEMYSTGRFFTVTGWHLPETPATIEPRHKPLQDLWAALFAAEGSARPVPASGTLPSPALPDYVILSKAFQARNKDKFTLLYTGDTSLYGRDESAADFALCGLLRFWTQDPVQIDRLFRQSGLMRPKWDEKRGALTYGARTVEASLSTPSEHYTPPPQLVVGGRPRQTPTQATSTGALVPPLPGTAQCVSPGVSTFLRAYIAHSQKWAPRAAPDYHAAVGLWVLSTIAARRLVVQMGSTDVFPTLFLALVAESTLWTKTTAAALGVRLIRRAGCQYLLSPDRTTPQFLLKLMAGMVPADYGTKHTDEQEAIDRAYGFCAKRGWFYEEWGSLLHQMRRHDSPQAELNKLLIVLEGGARTFETGTIQRGLERIEEPYLALLVNATPHDLYPFMQEDDAWWRDGFWPRFACVTPPVGGAPSDAPLPQEPYRDPAPLIVQLMDWHTKLGHPLVTIAEQREASGKRTGKWHGTITNFPQHVMELDVAAYDAYMAYNKAMFTLITDQRTPALVSADLRPWYSRAHEKALRVAMLLASVDGHDVITLPYWHEGQTLVETWRASLHGLVHEAGSHGDVNVKARRLTRIENRVIALLALHGPMTARQLQRHLYGVPSEELNGVLKNLRQIGAITSLADGQRTLYLIFDEQ